jgi:hypothetical protein
MMTGVLVALSGIALIVIFEVARSSSRYVRRTGAVAMRWSPRGRAVGDDEEASLLSLVRLVMRLGSVFGALLVIAGLIAIFRAALK